MILNKRALTSKELIIQKELDKIWADKVKARDNFSCQFCGSVYRPCAHHIVPREIKPYRYDLDNGITLCVKHHKFCRTLSAHNAPLAFFFWLEKYRNPLFWKARERCKELLGGECEI
jgi:hypothetical protein